MIDRKRRREAQGFRRREGGRLFRAKIEQVDFMLIVLSETFKNQGKKTCAKY